MILPSRGQQPSPVVELGALNARLDAATASHAKSAELVKNYRDELIRAHGVEIRYKKTDLRPLFGLTQFSWVHKRDDHLVLLHSGLKKICEPHVRAHELTHIAMASEARKKLGYLPSFAVEVEAAHDNTVSTKDAEILTSAFNRILDMAVEHTIQADTEFQPLSAAQFISLHAQMTAMLTELQGYRRLVANLPQAQQTSGILVTASNTVDCASALFVDRLFGGCTNYFSGFTEAFGSHCDKALAVKISDFCMGRTPGLGPADEYCLVDDALAMAGLNGLYQWHRRAEMNSE